MNVLHQKLQSSLTIKVFIAIVLLGVVHGVLQSLPGLFESECFSDGGICCRLSRRQRLLYRTRQQQFCRTLFWVGLCAMGMLAAWGLFRTCRSIALIPAIVPRFVASSRILERVGSFGYIGGLGSIKTSVGEESLVSSDQDLAELDRVIDDATINTWYAPHQTSQPGKTGRKPLPAASKLRGHLLCARKQLPSFHETCKQITRKTIYQAFCGVKRISAGTRSNFRASLTFEDLIALKPTTLDSSKSAPTCMSRTRLIWNPPVIGKSSRPFTGALRRSLCIRIRPHSWANGHTKKATPHCLWGIVNIHGEWCTARK